MLVHGHLGLSGGRSADHDSDHRQASSLHCLQVPEHAFGQLSCPSHCAGGTKMRARTILLRNFSQSKFKKIPNSRTDRCMDAFRLVPLADLRRKRKGKAVS